MSTLTTHTTGTRATPSGSNIGLCKFNTTNKAIEVSDGTNWLVYLKDGIASGYFPSNSYSGQFDGSGDYISVPTISELNAPSAFSTSCWFRPQGTVSNYAILSGGSSSSNRFYIQLQTATNIRYGNGSAFDDFTISSVSDTAWYHLATVQNGSTLEVFLNGTSVGTATVNAPQSGYGTYFTIGGYRVAGASTAFFNGYLDELSIFDTALTTTEIDNIRTKKVYPDRVALWRLENDATDNEGNYNGTNNGVTFVTSTKPY